MKNKLIDLNDHLFAQIERLGDEELSAEDIEREARRGEAIVRVADAIIDTAKTTLAAWKMVADHGDEVRPHLPMIGEKKR